MVPVGTGGAAIAKSFAVVLRELREARGLTMAQLAGQCGVRHVTISRYESGSRRPSWQAVQAIAAALRVRTERLRG